LRSILAHETVKDVKHPTITPGQNIQKHLEHTHTVFSVNSEFSLLMLSKMVFSIFLLHFLLSFIQKEKLHAASVTICFTVILILYHLHFVLYSIFSLNTTMSTKQPIFLYLKNIVHLNYFT